jgi:solute carrier family 25 (mitochondrial citrate transporter), member 1
MQSINARTDYGNSLKCAWTIYSQEGILSFWSGATPRLARLLLSGGIVFTMYVYLVLLMLIRQI